MNCRNSIKFLQSVTSEYRGPRILNLALTPEEEAAAAAEAAKAAEEAEAAEAAKAAEEEAAAKAAAEAEEDPLATPNPFEAGTAQAEAFEKQREKFKQKLAKETEAARKSAAGDLSGKLDELITTLSKTVEPKKKEEAPPAAPANEATPVDIEIITDALRKIGIDPTQIVKDRRNQLVKSAIVDLRKAYPGVEFDDKELVIYANNEGISKMGGSPYDILELALVRKHKDAFKAAPPPPPSKDPKKKEPVPILNNSTKTTPASDEKPKTAADWKKRIFGKYGAK